MKLGTMVLGGMTLEADTHPKYVILPSNTIKGPPHVTVTQPCEIAIVLNLKLREPPNSAPECTEMGYFCRT